MGASYPDLVARVGDALRRARISAVVTGGAAASIHTTGAYLSADVDLVLTGPVTQERLDDVMRDAGLRRDRDRYVLSNSPFYVEFPVGPLAIGEDHAIRPIVLQRRHWKFLALSPTDSCRDRLAAFYHWADRQSLAVAVEIALRHRVHRPRIRDWSRREGFAERLKEFEDTVAARKASLRRRERTSRS